MTYNAPENYDFTEIERLRRLSITDELTGLLNRRYFFNRLSQEISKSKRNKRPFSLLILDVDHFKEINDTYGHLEGDEVLRVVAKVLLKSVREMDVVTRYAGDEFIAILPESDSEDAYPVAQRILEETKQLSFLDPKGGGTFTVGVSVGISTFPDDGETATELIETADHGLYSAKKAGRNRVCFGDSCKDSPITEISFDGKISHFIGRSDELQRLIALYRTAAEFGLQVCLINGEAGVGKTRLIQELYNSIKQENVQFLQGVCFDTSIPMPYQPIREALSNFIEREEYYGYSILRTLPESAKVEILKVIPSLDTKRLGIQSAMMPDPVQDEYRLFDGIYQIFKKIAAKSPLVLFLDDIHWADTASLELFSYLIRNARDSHILICLTYRPEEVLDGNIERGAMASTIHRISRLLKIERFNLMPLDKKHVEEILNSIFAPHRYPKELVDLVFRETEGNPFFVEELLKSLIENKVIEFVDNAIVLKPTESINMPSSIRDLVIDRIEKLPSELQELLRIAATVGQEFSLRLLSGITNKNEGHIQDILDCGMDANIIKEDFSTSEEKFSFTHCKTREVLYYSLRESKRERLHLTIARALEKLYANDLDDHYEDLAQHYYLSRDKEKAFVYLYKCAKKVKASYAVYEAISYFLKTVELYDHFPVNIKEKYADDYTASALSLGMLHNIIGEYDKALYWLNKAGNLNEKLYEVDLNLGEVYVKKGNYEEALEHFKRALLKTDSDHTLASIETSMSYVYFRMSDFNESERLAKKAIQRLEDKSISLVSAEAYKNLGTVYYAKGLFAPAIGYYTKSLEISLQLNDKRAVANSYNNLGSVYYRQNDYEKAIDHLHKCLRIREEIGDKSGIVYSYNNIGNVYYNRCEYENAEKYYTQCLNISQEIGEQAAITASYNNIGNVYLAKEEFEEALEHYYNSLKISKKIGDKSGIARAYNGLGNVYFNLNEFDKAYKYHEDCLKVRKQIGDYAGMAFASINMAFASISMEKFDIAERHFLEGSRLKDEAGDAEGAITFCNQLIRLYMYLGRYSKIESMLEANLDRAQKLNLSELLAEIWGLYALYYISQDDMESARKSIQSMEKFAYAEKSSIPVSNFISYVKGKFCMSNGRYKKALPLFESALKYRRIKKSDIEYGLIMLDYVTALVKLQRFEEAAEKLTSTEAFFKSIAIDEVKKRMDELRETISKTPGGSIFESVDD